MSDTMMKVKVLGRAMKAWSKWHSIGSIVKLPVETALSLIRMNEAEEAPAKAAKKGE